MQRITMLILLLLAPLSSSARADQPEAAGGYCEWVQGVADSESSLLLSPQLFVNFGVVNSAALLSGEAAALPATLRLTAGLRFSSQRVYQGVLLRQRARAECKRYRAISELYGFIYADHERGTRAALTAKAKVLKDALPRADQILQAVQTAVSRREATVEELSATQLKADGLRQMAAQVEADLRSASEQSLPGAPIPGLVARRDVAESEVERVEGKIRRSQSWDLSLTGGYDLIFGARDQLPVLGMLSFSFYPGGLGQFHADAHARRGRSRFIAAQAEGVNQRAGRMLNRLIAVRKSEQVRLGETQVLMADLNDRIRAVESLSGEKVRKFRDYLWFDLVKVQAENAYLEAHLSDLRTALGEEAGAD